MRNLREGEGGISNLQLAIAQLEGDLRTIGGCGDGGCVVHVRPGQHTNGGCRCLRDNWITAQRVVGAYRRFATAVRSTVRRELGDGG